MTNTVLPTAGGRLLFLVIALLTTVPGLGAAAAGDTGTTATVSEGPWSVVVPWNWGRAGEVPTDFDYGDPSSSEQGHLEALNRARMDPLGEAGMFGFDLFEGVLPGAISADPVQPLTFNARLRQAAILHSEDMLSRQFFAHVNPDGLDPGERIAAVGYDFVTAGENLAVRGSTASIDEYATVIQMHTDLFIDTGIENRGHRVNILNPHYREVGIGVAFGAFDFNGRILPNSYMLTAEFGASRTDARHFVLGVVIDDADGDGFYSEGEGVAGVEIAVVEAGVSTVTASAGGYGIPVNPGAYTVEARHPDGRIASRQVTVGNLNVKVDFLLSEFSASAAVPSPTIAANGQTDFTTITSGNAFILGIGLAPGGFAGVPGDWWLVQISGGSVFSFDVGSFGFQPGLFATYQGPLLGFGTIGLVEVLPPPGNHLFCFGVDRTPDGALDIDTLSYDCVAVTVSP